MKAELTIGIDVGGTRTKAGLVNLRTGEVMQVIVQATEKTDGDLFVSGMKEVIDAFKSKTALEGAAIGGIGIGVPGFTKDGQVLTTYGAVSFMENYPLVKIAEKQFSLPCIIDNDARAVALGEALFGKGKEYNRVLVLTLGTGVGFGFVVNKKFSDAAPYSHMGGNMTITDEGGDCYCGKKGCLEALVSSTGILRLAELHSGIPQTLTVEDIFSAATTGYPSAVAVVNKVVGYLHTAIHNYTNLFAPDIVVLGGGIAKSLSPYMDKIKGRSYMGPYPGYDFTLTVSELEESAGVLGSAALVTHLQQRKTKQ